MSGEQSGTLHIIQPDCGDWLGYKPCDKQVAQGLTDCGGCEYFNEGLRVLDITREPYSSEALESASTIGVVEMGGLGSMLRTTAVTGAIRRINPGVRINWFTHDKGSELLRLVPGVTPISVHEVEVAAHAVEDTEVLLNFESNGAIAASLALSARMVGGFAINSYGKFFPASEESADLQRMQVDDRFRAARTKTMQQALLESVGLGDEDAAYDVALPTESYEKASLLIMEAFTEAPPQRLIGLNIGTSEKGAIRRWPVDRFVELARLLVRESDIGVVVLSGPDDGALRRQFDEATSDLVTHPQLGGVSDALSIADFIALTSKLDVLISGDTFGAHAGLSQGTPLLALAGPLPPNELELDSSSEMIGPKMPCSPCFGRCYNTVRGECMQEITTGEVRQRVLRMLGMNTPVVLQA